ncbi:MAG: DsbE family thiol:disulfide interchange protein [Gemmatimonadales bacterium]
MWRYLLPIAIFVVLAGFFARGLTLNPGYVPSPLIGKPAPQYELPRLKDLSTTVGSESYAGQVALVNVWATWCVECRNEHPFLMELSRTSDVPIHGLNWNDDRDTALEWLDVLGDPYVASAFDVAGEVAIDWGVYAAPETFLVGRDGTVLYKHISPMTPAVWSREFLPRIAAECGTLPCAPLPDDR